MYLPASLRAVVASTLVSTLFVFHCPCVRAATTEHAPFRSIKSRDDDRLAQLLKRHTPLNIRRADGTTPLMTAALHGSTKSVGMLLAAGADPNAANDVGATSLMWAVTDEAKVRLLLDQGAKVNVGSKLGNTPLLIASARSDGAPVLRILLERGADFRVRNSKGVSAIKNALIANSLETLQVLFEYAEAKDAVDELVGEDSTALLHDAALFGTVETATYLIEQLTKRAGGKLPNAGSAVALALFSHNQEIAQLLLRQGAVPNDLVRPAKAPAIMFATYGDINDASVLNSLLKRGLDPNGRSPSGDSALTWARRRGHHELIGALIDAGVEDPEEELPKISSRNIKLHAGNQQRLLRQAVTKSVELLQRSSDGFLEKRSCTSCHQNDLPAIAACWARDRGVRVDHGPINRVLQRQTGKSSAERVNRLYQIERDVTTGGGSIGYRLWEWSAIGYPADERTEAWAWFLAATQKSDGSWPTVSARPPMGVGKMQSTALALQALQLYPISSRTADFRQRVDLAAQWIGNQVPQNHQDQVFQILGLSWAGWQEDELVDRIDKLLQLQRADGGWSQLPNIPSDAWATGQSLIALHIGGGIPTNHPAYQRGLQFLLNTQFDDGSWYVRSRSFPFQEPFESGFPHGRDQWISAPASAWATMALTLAITPSEVTLPKVIGAASATEKGPSEVGYAAKQTREPEVDSGHQQQINFVRDIQPIFECSCLNCHSGDDYRGGLLMTELPHLLRGGESGKPAIVPENSEASLLFTTVSEKGQGLKMPPVDERDRYPALSDGDIGKLRRWIDDGAPWPKKLKLKRVSY